MLLVEGQTSKGEKSSVYFGSDDHIKLKTGARFHWKTVEGECWQSTKNFEVLQNLFILIALEKEWPVFRLQARCVHSDICPSTGGAGAVLGDTNPAGSSLLTPMAGEM